VVVTSCTGQSPVVVSLSFFCARLPLAVKAELRLSCDIMSSAMIMTVGYAASVNYVEISRDKTYSIGLAERPGAKFNDVI